MNQKDFLKMLNATNLQRYFRATPFSTIEGVDFDGTISPEMFFDEFYAGTTAADKLKEDILQHMEDQRLPITVLVGYSGCGKTTFLHYLLREKKEKLYLVDFESGIDNQVDDPILQKIKKDFNGLFSKDIIENHYKVLDSFYSICYHNSYLNTRLILDNIDTNNRIEKFLKSFYEEKIFSDILHNIYVNDNENSNIQMDLLISNYINDMTYNEILGFILLWDLSRDITIRAENPEYPIGSIFCFDNIDNIDGIEKTKAFIKAFAQFNINIRTVLKQLDLSEYNLSKDDILSSYSYLISYRETTYAKLTEHLNDKEQFLFNETDLSSIYNKREIVKKRNDYLIRNKENVSQQLFISANKINSLLENPILSNTVFLFFNNNYNMSIKTICQIYSKNLFYFDEYFSICQRDMGKYIRGANGLIFRLFFNFFKSKHYYEKLKLFDFSGLSEYTFSPARLILTYLNNKNQSVTLYDVYEYFDGVISPDDLTQVISDMYSLRYSEWRHLITFNKYPPTSIRGLESQLDLYKENRPISETRQCYSEIEITFAGKTYLRTMCSSFEFFAARIFGENDAPPLFSNKSIVDNKYQHTIREIYKKVDECIVRLLSLDKQIMKSKSWGLSEYYNSYLVYQNIDDYSQEKQFHGERIIFSHIGYINSFRLYLINSDLGLDKRKNGNKFVATYIIKYLDLYESYKCTKSHVNKNVAKDLREQAQYVFEHPDDFNTPIII